MKRLFAFVVVALVAQPFAACAQSERSRLAQPPPERCSNYSGTWNASGSGHPYQEFRQTGCRSLEITEYRSMEGQAKPKITWKKTVQIDDVWRCEPGAKEEMRCIKARWRTPSDLLISEATYEESCLSVVEHYNQAPNVIRSEWSSSCPGGRTSHGSFSLMERVRGR